MIRILVAIALLVFVFFGKLPTIDIKIPDKVDEVQSIINVEKPTDEILVKVKPIADLITDNEDRAKFALFNYEFGSRVINYSTDSQKINDVYTKAGGIFFQESLRGKYPGLADELKGLLESVVSNDNHALSDSEKQSIQKLFKGLAWALIER